MSILVYKNGVWEETIPFIYKNGAWVQASTVKVYENGEWVEKIASYDNMEISISTSSGNNGFAVDANNYIKCSANNIKCLYHLKPAERLSATFNLLPEGDNFGKAPIFSYDYLIRSNGMINSSTYASKVVFLSYMFYEYGLGRGPSIASNVNQLEKTGTASVTLDIDDSNNPVTDINIIISVDDTDGVATTASVYIEINNIKVNGVPYGINQTITP